jgi:hypothetical protein
MNILDPIFLSHVVLQFSPNDLPKIPMKLVEPVAKSVCDIIDFSLHSVHDSNEIW